MSNLKHVGKFGEKPCIILYREVPDESQNCLIVESAGLSDSKHDELMRVVLGAEAQQPGAVELSEVLKRNNFSDGSIMLDSLHYAKMIKKVSVDMVSFTPTPGQAVPLSLVNEELRKIKGGHVEPKTSESHLPKSPGAAAKTNPNPSSGNNETVDPAAKSDIAANLKMQAELMLGDAAAMQAAAEAKLAEAIKLDPTLAEASS